ncbi:MAG: hypothetical protein U0S48_13105 [Solirubrobacteraceae bacterium]
MAKAGRDAVPGGVAVVAILAIIVGIVEVIGGLLIVIFNQDVSGMSSGEAVIFGIVTIVVGLVYLWVGNGLRRLNEGALFVGLIVSGFRLAYDVVWLIIFGVDGIGFSGVITLVINALVFAALWSGRGAFNGSTPRTA